MGLLLLAFVLICVFDPADVIIGGKVFVFGLLWLLTLRRMANSGEGEKVSQWLLKYVLLFIAIPVFSVIWYYAFHGSKPFDGLLYLKAYLLVSLALVLNINKIDLVPMLSGALVLLAAITVTLYAAIVLSPGLFLELREPGANSGMVYLDWRGYGKVTLLQVYFPTSPMLVVPIAYYFDCMMTTKWKVTYLSLCALCIAGMIATGTRNNIFIALLLPALLWPLYTKRPALYFALSLCAVGVLALPFLGKLRSLLDPAEAGNSIRIGLLGDYARIFSEPATLIFGRGLGAYETWTARTPPTFGPISELTFFEIIRNFGIPAGGFMIGLLLAPVVFLWRGKRQNRALALAYALFLVMSFSNPMLFNSIGILVLSAMLARRVPPVKSELAFGRVAPGT